MSKKSMKQKVEDYMNLKSQRNYEEKSLRFDERRDFTNDARAEAVEALED